MNIFSVILQGIIQGVTEFLPVSSSGHLALIQYFLDFKENNLFVNVMLHLGTLFAVVFVYHKLILNLIKEFFTLIPKIFRGEFKYKNLNETQKMVVNLIIGLLPLFLLFAPMPFSNTSFKEFAENLSNNSNILAVGASLLVTSLLLFYSNFKQLKLKESGKSIKKFDALLIGFAQFAAALFPGLSRSGSTFSVGLLRNVDRRQALDYSFVLGIPAILAASILKLKEAVEFKSVASTDVFAIVLGLVISGVVGFFSIKLFKWLVEKSKVKIFAFYTLILGLISVIIGIYQMI